MVQLLAPYIDHESHNGRGHRQTDRETDTQQCRRLRHSSTTIDDAVDEWRKRRHCSVETSGRHLEHLL